MPYEPRCSYSRLVMLCFIVSLLLTPALPIQAANSIFLPVIKSGDAVVNAAATNWVTVLVQLASGATITQVSVEHQVTIVSAIPALSIYRLQGNNPQLLAELANDNRIAQVQPDDKISAFDAQQRDLYGTGSDFDALQRYFGFGSGDNSTNNSSGGGKKTKEQVLVTSNNQALNKDWQTWGERDMHLDAAQKRTTGDGVTVAVLDTGVDLTHPLLVGHVTPGYNFVENDDQPSDAPNGLDDDEDGVIDEGVGHGTHVTGIIATVAPQARIMPIRVLNSDGGGTLFDIVNGLVYAVDHGAQVINLSLSSPINSPLLEAAIQYAFDHQVIVIAAAAGGAAGLNYPAAYPQVIAVGSVTRDHHVTDFSQPYAQLVDIFAPGENIYSTYYNGYFAWWTGTSMSAPFVTGEAALLLSPGTCQFACVRDAIINAVDPVSGFKEGGRVNLDKATKVLKLK